MRLILLFIGIAGDTWRADAWLVIGINRSHLSRIAEGERSGLMGVEMLRCAQHDKRGLCLPAALALPERVHLCHPERSEGSGAGGGEMLRCAQHDKVPFKAGCTRDQGVDDTVGVAMGVPPGVGVGVAPSLIVRSSKVLRSIV